MGWQEHLDKLKHSLIPLPPAPEQRGIVRRTHEFMALCDALEAKLRHAERLMESVVERLLNGEAEK